MTKTPPLQSKGVVVITGASRGIGEACAHHFAKANFELILVGRNQKDLARVAKHLGPSHRIVARNLNDSKVDADILRQIGKRKLVGLINNAGIFRRLSFEESAMTDWREQFETNFFSAVRLTKSLLPKLQETKFASIVNISSSVGLRTASGMAAYAASKAAMDNWTQSMALELAPGVRVNGICPGIIDTPIHSFNKAQVQDLKGAQPLGRIGTPDDVAHATLFLFEASWITGVLLPVDGGISLT